MVQRLVGPQLVLRQALQPTPGARHRPYHAACRACPRSPCSPCGDLLRPHGGAPRGCCSPYAGYEAQRLPQVLWVAGDNAGPRLEGPDAAEGILCGIRVPHHCALWGVCEWGGCWGEAGAGPGAAMTVGPTAGCRLNLLLGAAGSKGSMGMVRAPVSMKIYCRELHWYGWQTTQMPKSSCYVSAPHAPT